VTILAAILTQFVSVAAFPLQILSILRKRETVSQGHFAQRDGASEAKSQQAFMRVTREIVSRFLLLFFIYTPIRPRTIDIRQILFS
jgi:hypothetical protein